MNSTSDRLIYMTMKISNIVPLLVNDDDNEIEQIYEDITTARKAENLHYRGVMSDVNVKLRKLFIISIFNERSIR